MTSPLKSPQANTWPGHSCNSSWFVPNCYNRYWCHVAWVLSLVFDLTVPVRRLLWDLISMTNVQLTLAHKGKKKKADFSSALSLLFVRHKVWLALRFWEMYVQSSDLRAGYTRLHWESWWFRECALKNLDKI